MNANDRDPSVTARTHVIAEYSGCKPGILNDEGAVESLLVEAAQASGAIVWRACSIASSPRRHRLRYG